jgi:hypothetical protein
VCFRIPDDAQNPKNNNSGYYTPSSEPFVICLNIHFFKTALVRTS